MYWLDKVATVLFYYFLLYMFYSYSTTVQTVVHTTWDLARGFVPPSIMGGGDSSPVSTPK
jgi:hypothetical protein